MFSVDLGDLSQCIQKMDDHVGSMSRKIEELRDCQSELQSLSGMSEVYEQIQSLTAQLEYEKDGFKQLGHTLLEAARYYGHCEKKIDQHVEQSKIQYHKKNADFCSLREIDSLFRELNMK